MNAGLCFDLAQLFRVESALPASADEVDSEFPDHCAVRLHDESELRLIADYWDIRGVELVEKSA